METPRTQTSTRRPRPQPTPPATPTATSSVTVASGPYAEQLPVVGMTVGGIRERYGDRFDISPDSLAYVDGHEVGNETSVTPDQVLIFQRRAGEKG